MKTDRCHYFRSRALFALILFLMSSAAVSAQKGRVGVLPEKKEKISTYSVGVGHYQVLDQYMSPNVYRGPEYQLAFQRQHLLNRSEDWLLTTYQKVGASMLKDRNGYGGFMTAMYDSRYSWEYLWIDRDRFTLTGGPELFVKVGGLFNQKNSNNVAQLKLYMAGALSGEARYRFRIWNLPLALGWRMELPLVGYNFAPTYGLQYYEIGYLGRFGEASHLAWPGNLQNLSQCVSVDVPVGSVQLRLSYYGDYFRYNMGGVKCRLFDSSFMIGFMKRVELKYNGR